MEKHFWKRMQYILHVYYATKPGLFQIEVVFEVCGIYSHFCKELWWFEVSGVIVFEEMGMICVLRHIVAQRGPFSPSAMGWQHICWVDEVVWRMHQNFFLFSICYYQLCAIIKYCSIDWLTCCFNVSWYLAVSISVLHK